MSFVKGIFRHIQKKVDKGQVLSNKEIAIFSKYNGTMVGNKMLTIYTKSPHSSKGVVGTKSLMPPVVNTNGVQTKVNLEDTISERVFKRADRSAKEGLATLPLDASCNGKGVTVYGG